MLPRREVLASWARNIISILTCRNWLETRLHTKKKTWDAWHQYTSTFERRMMASVAPSMSEWVTQTDRKRTHVRLVTKLAYFAPEGCYTRLPPEGLPVSRSTEESGAAYLRGKGKGTEHLGKKISSNNQEYWPPFLGRVKLLLSDRGTFGNLLMTCVMSNTIQWRRQISSTLSGISADIS